MPQGGQQVLPARDGSHSRSHPAARRPISRGLLDQRCRPRAVRCVRAGTDRPVSRDQRHWVHRVSQRHLLSLACLPPSPRRPPPPRSPPPPPPPQPPPPTLV